MTVNMDGSVADVRYEVKLVYNEKRDVTEVIDGGEAVVCHCDVERICATNCAAFYSEEEVTYDAKEKEMRVSYCQCLLLPKWARWMKS